MWFLFRIYGTLLFFFFFQAEDGIRDLTVTGVQTCALPIYGGGRRPRGAQRCTRGAAGRDPRTPRRRAPATRRSVSRGADGQALDLPFAADLDVLPGAAGDRVLRARGFSLARRARGG